MYDFDRVINRRNTFSYKWDIKENELAMWVADMDFQTAPEIRKALMERVEHGVFGYSVIPDEWYTVYINWWKNRHHFTMEADWLVFCTGVVPALSTCVRKLTTPAENVLIMTPVYNIFFNSILNNGRNVIESRLVYENGAYHIDFDDLEAKLQNPQTSLMILCNPHNPIGKIWDKQTLEKIGHLCAKHHVVVVSDEIHCDIVKPGCEYIPFVSVSEECRMNSVTCIAPTKCFNLAGLQSAAVCVPNPQLRHKVWRALNTDEVAEPNAFAMTATIAAFTQGEQWLNELNQYIEDNRQCVCEFILKEIPQLSVVESQATYLLWIDCRKVPQNNLNLWQFLREKEGLYLSEGAEYGGDGGDFLRMNVACPRSMVRDGLNRLKRGIECAYDFLRLGSTI